MSSKTAAASPLEKHHYVALAEFRYQLRRFLAFSEKAAQAEGITPLQYQLLLQVQGFPGRDWASVGELAERLQMKPHGMVALLSRCEAGGLILRTPGEADRRQVQIRLRPDALALLARLATLHRTELGSLKDTFRVEKITSFNLEGK